MLKIPHQKQTKEKKKLYIQHQSYKIQTQLEIVRKENKKYGSIRKQQEWELENLRSAETRGVWGHEFFFKMYSNLCNLVHFTCNSFAFTKNTYAGQ